MALTSVVIHAFIQLLGAFWWLIPILIVIGFLKLPSTKGAIGEFQVNLAAKFLLDKTVYKLFKNVTLPTEDGTTQIDHIIVSRYGVFVIETKNLQGWIFGGAQQKTWTQKIYRHTSKFQNPLHQNYKHTQTLQAALGLDADKVFSLVVFVGDSEFKTPMPDNVVQGSGYVRYIKNQTQARLSEREVAEICARIEAGRLKPSLRTHRAHVRHVRALHEEKARQADTACPKCGQPWVLRTARSGANQGKQFWGCSGYPKCRSIKQMT
jgi:restriction system protein